ncbi:MAG: arylesterase [Rhodospirillales bacterium]
MAIASLIGPMVAVVMALAALPAKAAEPVRVLVLGDSLTAGYGLPRGEGFTVRLQQALAAQGLSVDVINGGVSGDTSAGGRARLAWMLGNTPAEQPDAVIIELGANDGLRGVDPNVTYGNLDAILGELKRRNIPVLLTGMYALPNYGADYGRRFAAVYTRLVEGYKVPFYPFFLDGVAGIAALNQADGVHPNAAGVDEIVRRITPAVVTFLREIAAGEKTG